MIAFIDDYREAHGVEPICKVLPIAPFTSVLSGARKIIHQQCSPAGLELLPKLGSLAPSRA